MPLTDQGDLPLGDKNEPLLVELPFGPLAPLSAEAEAELEAGALRFNDRYLEIIEGRAFCPYAKHGRLQQRTKRFVYHADTVSLDPLVALMAQCADDPSLEVIQLIMPRVQVTPKQWAVFCHGLTRAGHERIGGEPVLACAPLHPELPFTDETPYSLVPLFRRAPQPTLQWVRLGALAAIYKDRGSDDRYVDPDDLIAIAALATETSPRAAVYDQVCEANAATVARMGVDKVVAMLAAIATEAAAAELAVNGSQDA